MMKPPSWAKNAVPTLIGWKDARTGELLKSTKLAQADIDAYLGKTVAPAPAPVAPAPASSDIVITEWVAEDVDGDGTIDDLESLSKIELEELGREHGHELDRRKTRKTLVAEMREILNS